MGVDLELKFYYRSNIKIESLISKVESLKHFYLERWNNLNFERGTVSFKFRPGTYKFSDPYISGKIEELEEMKLHEIKDEVLNFYIDMRLDFFREVIKNELVIFPLE